MMIQMQREIARYSTFNLYKFQWNLYLKMLNTLAKGSPYLWDIPTGYGKFILWDLLEERHPELIKKRIKLVKSSWPPMSIESLNKQSKRFYEKAWNKFMKQRKLIDAHRKIKT